MKKRNLILGLAVATVLATAAIPASAALNWDGQSGIFLNALAYTAAPSSVEVSLHNADLDNLGSVATYNVAFGLKNNVEVGYTRYGSNVNGVNNQDLLSAKWQFLPETQENPAAAAWVIHRSISGDSDTTDYGLSVTKVVKVGEHPLVLDLGARSTKALGLGLFGIGAERKLKLEGSFAFFVTSKFAVGAEFKQQIGTRAWRDIAVRYIVSDKLNLDAGIADFGPGLDNQLALAATYKL